MTAQPQPGVPLVPGAASKGFLPLIRRHPVPAYYVLAFFISWGGMAAILNVGHISATWAAVALPVGPAASCIFLTRLVYGQQGLHRLRSRLRQWRVGARWYVVALLTGPAVMAATAAAVSSMFPGYYAGSPTAGGTVAIVLGGIMVGLMVGILEELGWTGFALPLIRGRYGILSTGLIMALLWGTWHYPMFAGSTDPSGAVPAVLIVAVFLFAWLPPFRVLMVWVYDQTGSLPLAMLMHAPLSAGAFINSFMASGQATGTAILMPALMWGVSFWAIVGVVFLILSRQKAGVQDRGGV